MALKFNIEGLEQFKETVNPTRIRKEAAIALGSLARAIHSELNHEVFSKYNVKSNPLDSVLIRGSRSLQEFGKNIVRASYSMEYKNIPVDLSKFSSGYTVGNIPPLPKKRVGVIEFVTVKRGQQKIVYGKDGLGGFIPRNGERQKIQVDGKNMMFERETSDRFPVHRLFGPSLAQMASSIYDTSPSLKNVLDRAEDVFAEGFNI